MGLKTKIEYADSTMNFWVGGCNKISEGCKNCFAEKIYKCRFGKDFSVPIKSKNFDAPLKWRKPSIILVNDMSDFFHKNIPLDWKAEAIKIMVRAEKHIFLLLTKRANEMKELMLKIIEIQKRDVAMENIIIPRKVELIYPKNIWLGVSVENQKTADERIPELLKIPHFRKWLSVEPMLEEINIRKYLTSSHSIGAGLYQTTQLINWVVCGGESGVSARELKREWVNHLLNGQCKFTGVPFFMKQMSKKEPIPKDLMVREYPPEIKRIINNKN